MKNHNPHAQRLCGLFFEIAKILCSVYVACPRVPKQTEKRIVVVLFTIENLRFVFYNKSMTNNKTDITINTYNNIVNEYDDYFNSKDLQGGTQFQKEIETIVSMLPSGAVILDAGTALGAYPKYLTERVDKDFKVVGIDAAPNMIEKAKSVAPKAEFHTRDIRDLQFPPKSFDAVICFATLIHVNDQEALKVLEKFDEILKQNGIIAINVMEKPNSQDKEIFIDEPFNTEYKTYFNRYNKSFFLDYFNSKGYKVLATYDDNELFNTEAICIGEDLAGINQFSIIAQK